MPLLVVLDALSFISPTAVSAFYQFQEIHILDFINVPNSRSKSSQNLAKSSIFALNYNIL